MGALDELRRLHETATPGCARVDSDGAHPLVIVEDDDGFAETVAQCGLTRKLDARLDAAMRNALPALLDVAEAARGAPHWIECVGHIEECETDPCDGCKVRTRLHAALARLESGGHDA